MENEDVKLAAEIEEVLVALKLSADGDEEKEYVVSVIKEMARGCNSLTELYSVINDAYETADCTSIELSLAVAENDAEFACTCKALDMLKELASFDGQICNLG